MNTNIITFKLYYNEVMPNIENLEKMLARYKENGDARSMSQMRMSFSTIRNKLGFSSEFKSDINWIESTIASIKERLEQAKQILSNI